mgnify:CR=1 FL=1
MVQNAVTKPTVCVVGLGYVGTPLAEAFAEHVPTIGFDIDRHKVDALLAALLAALRVALRHWFPPSVLQSSVVGCRSATVRWPRGACGHARRRGSCLR